MFYDIIIMLIVLNFLTAKNTILRNGGVTHMGTTIEITFSAKDLKQAARLQQQFVTQMEAIGYQFHEFKAVPAKNKVEATLVLVRKRKSI